MDSGIYQIRNVRNDLIYIGSAKRFEERFRVHRCLLKKGKHHSPHLQRSWNKYGEKCFAFEIIEEVPLVKELLIEREQHYIDTLKPRYNASPTAGSNLGLKLSAKSRAKISAVQKGKRRGPCSPERNAKLAASQRGHIVNLITRMKISASLTGKKAGPRPEWWKLKISEAQKGKPREYARGPKKPEHIENMRLGIQKSWEGADERRAQLSARMTGYKHTDEARAKMSAGLKGKLVWWQKRGFCSLAEAIRAQQGNSGESPITE